jgi:hypothetical protein
MLVSDFPGPGKIFCQQNTPKALGNLSPIVGGQRQPWDKNIKQKKRKQNKKGLAREGKKQ